MPILFHIEMPFAPYNVRCALSQRIAELLVYLGLDNNSHKQQQEYDVSFKNFTENRFYH